MNLKTLNNHSLQEIFDFVVNHLLTQNEQSCMTDGVTCAYRGERGLQCAVGCLISDDEYDPKFENQTINYVYPRGSPALRRLLRLLQTCHDQYPTDKWPSLLKRIAVQSDLTWNH